MFYAALEATLLAYLREDYDSIPTLRMMRIREEDLQQRAEHMVRHLMISSPRFKVEVVASRSVLGGGSAPGTSLPSRAVAVKSGELSADRLLVALRGWETPIIARVEEERVLLDLRTVEPGQDAVIVAALESFGRTGLRAASIRMRKAVGGREVSGYESVGILSIAVLGVDATGPTAFVQKRTRLAWWRTMFQETSIEFISSLLKGTYFVALRGSSAKMPNAKS